MFVVQEDQHDNKHLPDFAQDLLKIVCDDGTDDSG